MNHNSSALTDGWWALENKEIYGRSDESLAPQQVHLQMR